LLAAVALILAGCAAEKESRTYPLSGKSYVINGKRYHILASARGYVQEGEASWYGRNFHGKKTANGEAYNMYGLTAAHKTLPINTWVKVTNLANFREVTVRINDRGPFVRGRVIDLSYAGAKQLGIAATGTAPVRIEALGTAKEVKVNGQVRTVLVQPKSYTEGRFGVQVGSFQNRTNAEALVERLRREFGYATIEVFDRGDAVFYRVRVADKRSLGQAMKLQAQLERQGFRDCFVVAR